MFVINISLFQEELFEKEFLKCDNSKCTNGAVKPDIVFFGEKLPEQFSIRIEQDFPKCDLLLIMGTSLQVHPFASLTSSVSSDCPRLLINRDAVGDDLLYNEPNSNYRDVFLQDDCDNGCKKLAKLLGWESELHDLVIKNDSYNSNKNNGKIDFIKNVTKTKNEH